MLSTVPRTATTREVDGISVMEDPADAFARAPRLVVDSAPMATMGGSAGDPAYDLTHARHVVVRTEDENGVVALRVFSIRPEPVTPIRGD